MILMGVVLSSFRSSVLSRRHMFQMRLPDVSAFVLPYDERDKVPICDGCCSVIVSFDAAEAPSVCAFQLASDNHTCLDYCHLPASPADSCQTALHFFSPINAACCVCKKQHMC